MKRILMAMIIIALVITCGAGCSVKNKGVQPPIISVAAGEQNLKSETLITQWENLEGSEKSETDPFVVDFSTKELVYVKLNQTIQIDLDGKTPDQVILEDRLLNVDGTRKYDKRTDTVIPLKIENGKASFELKPSLASALSSNSKDYEAGNTYRGFRMICNWGENKCEYRFVVKTDAN